MSNVSNLILPGAGRLLRLASAGIVGFALIASSLAWLAREQQVDRVVNEAQLRARGAAADVDRYLQAELGTLEAIAASPAIWTADPEGMREYFDRLDASALGFSAGIAWIDTEGWMRVRGGYRGPGIDFSDREHVRAVLSGEKRVVSSAFTGALNQVAIVSLAVPTYDASGRLTGLIGAGLRLDSLRIGADNLRYAGGTDVRIVDRRSQIIAGEAPITELRTVDPDFRIGEMRQRVEGALTDAVDAEGHPGEVIGFAAVPTAGWLVLVDRSQEEAFGAADRQLAWQVASIALSAGIVAGLLLWAARRVDRAARAQAAALEAERDARDELEAAMRELEQRQAMRDAFVGVMSHELRTPVTTIFGAAKLLARSPDREDRESLVLDIEEESDRLHRITEDLLVLSRAERGAMVVEAEPVLLQRVVPSIRNDLRRRYPAITFEFDVPEALPPLAAEPGPIRQIINNLLTNAAKYGAGSPVGLTARADGHTVRIVVEDEGVGFPAAEADQLFELFYRSATNARSAAGTGIGLYVVRQLTEGMGGTVTAAPREPRGARFTVVLPSYAADTVEPRESEPSGGAHGTQQ